MPGRWADQRQECGDPQHTNSPSSVATPAACSAGSRPLCRESIRSAMPAPVGGGRSLDGSARDFMASAYALCLSALLATAPAMAAWEARRLPGTEGPAAETAAAAAGGGGMTGGGGCAPGRPAARAASSCISAARPLARGEGAGDAAGEGTEEAAFPPFPPLPFFLPFFPFFPLRLPPMVRPRGGTASYGQQGDRSVRLLLRRSLGQGRSAGASVFEFAYQSMGREKTRWESSSLRRWLV